MMTEAKAEAVRKLKIKTIHFAWDRYEDKDSVVPALKAFQEITGWKRSKVQVYVLINFGSTLEQDLERIYTIRDIGFSPYVMVYDKAHADKDKLRLMRWVDDRYVFNKVQRFEDYRR